MNENSIMDQILDGKEKCIESEEHIKNDNIEHYYDLLAETERRNAKYGLSKTNMKGLNILMDSNASIKKTKPQLSKFFKNRVIVNISSI